MKCQILFILFFQFLDGNLGAEQCGKPADIAFVIDSSSSIWIYDFQRQIQFVQELVKRFDIGPDKTRVAAVTFGHTVTKEFYLDETKTQEEIIEKIGNIKHSYGKQTLTHDALNYMRTELFSPAHGAREGVPKVCILLTDGRSTYEMKTLNAAIEAKQKGIKILAIGIGDKVKDSELETIVSPPAENNYFKSPTFGDLEKVDFQELVGQKACEVIQTTTTKPATTTTTSTTTTTTTPSTTTTEMQKEEPKETCQGKEADVIIIVDMSSSIWVEDFKKQLGFLSDLVSNFDIDSGKTQVGMLAFSDEAKVQFYLDSYTSAADVSKAILGVKSEGGITNTHLALQKLLDEMLTREHGSRSSVAHICILITDGRSSKPDLTLPQAELVHDSGVYVFAIGVGNMTDKTELVEMASKPEYAFEVNGYKALPQIKNILAYKTCEVPQGDEPDCAKDVLADIMFGLYNIGGDIRGDVTEFMKRVGSAFGLEAGNVRCGLRENCGRAELQLNKFGDPEEFKASLTNAMETDLSSLILNLRTSFGSRMNADRVVILLVSGNIEDIEKAADEANRLKFNSRVIVVGIGKGVNKDQLMRIASYKSRGVPDISHVFQVENPADLEFLVKKILVLMCKEQK